MSFRTLAKPTTVFVVSLGLFTHSGTAPAQAGGKDAALFVGGVLAGVIVSEAIKNNQRQQYSPPPPPPRYVPPSHNPTRYTPPPRRVKKRHYYNRSEVRRIQMALNTLGYNAGAVDGAVGPGTRGAISEFQYGINARPTGALTVSQKIILFDRASVASRNNQNNRNNQNTASFNNSGQNNQNNANQNTQNNATQVSVTQTGVQPNQQPTQTVSSKQGRIKVQKALNALGYPAGKENGRMTAQTRQAIKAFQLDISHQPTGLLSQEARQILFRDAADVTPKVSSTQGRIKVQQALNTLGYPAGDETGRMTTQTREAIKAFQLDISHQPTGILSADERQILFRDAADLGNDGSG